MLLTLVVPFLIGAGCALELDVNSADSIKSTAKTLASAITKYYNDALEVPGLFEDPYFFWESGTVWNALVEYSYLTGDAQFDDVVSKALQFQVSEERNFMPVNQTKTLGNDDQSTWALAAMTAAEVGFPKPSDGEWIDLAKNVFDVQVLRWDEETCGGGLKWQIFSFNNGYNYKNAISTGNFFLLAARLAQSTGNETYSDWAEKSFKWTQDVGLLSEDFHVFDGTDDTQDCSQVNHIQWSANHAVFTEGAAIMYNLTSSNEWKDAVTSFANGSSDFLDKDSTNVLTEVACEENGKCDVDQKAYKGIAARSFARAAMAAPFISDSFRPVIEASAKGAAENCDGDEESLSCSQKWTKGGEAEDGLTEGGLGEAFGALEVVQALLYQQAGTGSSPNSPSNSTAPTGSGSGSPSGTATGAPATVTTNAAGQAGIIWGGLVAAGMLAVLGS